MSLFAWLPKLDKCCFQFPLKIGVIIIIVWLLGNCGKQGKRPCIKQTGDGQRRHWCECFDPACPAYKNGHFFQEDWKECRNLEKAYVQQLTKQADRYGWNKKSTQISDTVCVLLCVLFLVVILHFVMLTYWLVTKKDYEACEMSYIIGYFGVIFMIILMGYIIIIINSYAMEAATSD